MATHVFYHFGLWHILWNMLMLYWFGNIVGDLLGGQDGVVVYIVSGLTGALVIFIFSNLFNYPSAEDGLWSFRCRHGFCIGYYNDRTGVSCTSY
ncbi:MAG: rhomboid family intramembrane serine protease [Saprospiraceae bacterium]|nr:rhomboid family intramembrane serine protease [Saprospiraceae bacterium]